MRTWIPDWIPDVLRLARDVFRYLAFIAFAITLLVGCADSGTGPKDPLDVTVQAVSAQARIVFIEVPPWTFEHVRCDMRVRIQATGGKAQDVAVFESGEWRAGDGAAFRGTLDLPWFTDIWGSDRVRSGQTLVGSFYYQRGLADGGYTFVLTLRFRLPDGSLRPRTVSISCVP